VRRFPEVPFEESKNVQQRKLPLGKESFMILGSLMGLDQTTEVMAKLLNAEEGMALADSEEYLARIEERTKHELFNNPVISAQIIRNPVIIKALADAISEELRGHLQ
jgi:hypothetical protein